MNKSIVLLLVIVLLGLFAAGLLGNEGYTNDPDPAPRSSTALLDNAGESAHATDAPKLLPSSAQNEIQPIEAARAVSIEAACRRANPNLHPAVSQKEAEERIEETIKRVDEATKVLQGYGMRQHLTARALLTRSAQSKVDLLAAALTQEPNNVVTLWHAVRACQAAVEAPACRTEQWLQTLTELDSSNANVWLLDAHHQFKNGNKPEALISLQRAEMSSEMMNYRTVTAQLINAAFASTGLLTQSEELIAGGAIHFVRDPLLSKYGRMCRDLQSDRDWATACSRVFERIALSPLGFGDAERANRYRVAALTALGDEDAADTARAQFEERLSVIGGKPEFSDDAVLGWLVANPDLLNRFFWTMMEEGEVGGVRYLINELGDEVFFPNKPSCKNVLGTAE